MADSGELVPRRSVRLPVDVEVRVDHPRSHRRVQAEMTDLSREGCRIVSSERFDPAAQLLVLLPKEKAWPACVVWEKDGATGLEFHTPLPDRIVAKHALRFQQGAPGRRR